MLITNPFNVGLTKITCLFKFEGQMKDRDDDYFFAPQGRGQKSEKCPDLTFVQSYSTLRYFGDKSPTA